MGKGSSRATQKLCDLQSAPPISGLSFPTYEMELSELISQSPARPNLLVRWALWGRGRQGLGDGPADDLPGGAQALRSWGKESWGQTWEGRDRKGSTGGQGTASRCHRQEARRGTWGRGGRGSPLLGRSLPEAGLGRGRRWRADLSSGATFTPATAQLPGAQTAQTGKRLRGAPGTGRPLPTQRQPSGGRVSWPLSGRRGRHGAGNGLSICFRSCGLTRGLVCLR